MSNEPKADEPRDLGREMLVLKCAVMSLLFAIACGFVPTDHIALYLWLFCAAALFGLVAVLGLVAPDTKAKSSAATGR